MSNNLKHLVQEIQKLAQDIPVRTKGPRRGGGGVTTPATDVPTRTKPKTTPTAQTGAVSRPVSDDSVRNMQLAIQNLAKTISGAINYDTLIKSMQQPETVGDKAEFQAQYGKDMFSNFMVHNYLRRPEVKGVEYDTDPSRQKLLEKKPSDLKSMYIILDTLQRIGKQSAERWADGDWGFRTNNALKNISALANALAQLGSDLGAPPTSFDPGKIAELSHLIPVKETDLSPQEKMEVAPKITEIVNGVRDMFLDFQQHVLKDPTYRVFIEGKAPIVSFGPKKEAVVQPSTEEQSILSELQQKGATSRFSYPGTSFPVTLTQEYIPVQFKGTKLPPLAISGADLVSPQAFDSWTDKSKVLSNIKQQNPQSWPNLVKSILGQIRSQIDQKLTPAVKDFGPGF